MKPALAFALVLTLAGCGGVPTVGPAVRPVVAQAAKALDPARFFASPTVQAQAPLAFAQQPAALEALKAMDAAAPAERRALIRALEADAGVKRDIARFGALGWDARLAALRKVMAIECKVMGIQAPPLVIGTGKARAAYFEFDPARPGTGRVFLYPEALAEEADPYAALLLLMHETRHSAQFQLAYGDRQGPLAAGYKAAFEAQKRLEGKLSFCDFCSLLNEHEAFQMANFVVGELAGGKADTSGMGCLSSQYDTQGRLRIDLVALAEEVGPAGVLAAFNRLERPQFEQFGGLSGRR